MPPKTELTPQQAVLAPQDPTKIGGWVVAGLSALPAVLAGIGAGTARAVDGGSFEEGADEGFNRVFNAAAKFGDEKSDHVVNGFLTGIATAAGAAVVGGIILAAKAITTENKNLKSKPDFTD